MGEGVTPDAAVDDLQIKLESLAGSLIDDGFTDFPDPDSPEGDATLDETLKWLGEMKSADSDVVFTTVTLFPSGTGDKRVKR